MNEAEQYATALTIEERFNGELLRIIDLYLIGEISKQELANLKMFAHRQHNIELNHHVQMSI